MKGIWKKIGQGNLKKIIRNTGESLSVNQNKKEAQMK